MSDELKRLRDFVQAGQAAQRAVDELGAGPGTRHVLEGRQAAIDVVACPTCGAAVGAFCRTERGPLLIPHRERMRAARALCGLEGDAAP